MSKSCDPGKHEQPVHIWEIQRSPVMGTFSALFGSEGK